MASHSELRPDDAALPLLIASAALSKAESRVTVATGTVVADNADGTQTWIGANGSDDTGGVIRWVGDLSVPGRPLGLSAACSMQCVVVSWDGTLEGGVPSDFAYVEVFARREGSVDDVVSWGRLSSAGMLMSPRYDIGTVFDTYAIAYDDAHDSTGALARNRSEQSDLITVAVEQDADMEQIDAAVEEMSKKADEAIAKGEQIRRDAQAGIDDARKQAQAVEAKADKVRTDLETAASQLESNIAAVDKKADQVRSDLTRQVQDAKSEMDSTVKAAQSAADKAQSAADAAQKAADKANADTADLDKTVQVVDAKAAAAKQAAAEAQSKAENVASDLDSANAVIEQHTTELGALTTKVSNAVKKSESALSVSTEAKQTATEASTTATSAYNDSQTALTQSTTATQTATTAKTTAESASKTANDSLKQSSAAVQTANQISTTLRTEYQTKADADKIYATQSSLKATSDSLSANITANAKTAQSAVDKATSLEANLNGFKTTVSQTYTTKNDFNNLTIGGRNLLVKSNFIKTWIDTVNGTLEVPDAPVSVPGYNGDSSSKKPIVVDPDTTYILSAYDLMNGTGAYTGRISQFNSEGALINFIVPSINIRDKGHITFTTDINAAYILVGIYAFPKCRWKLEKGTKPTDWSPAPEDLQPVGDYATNSSLTQTAESIKSQVAEVFKTANSAMSKATTVEQTTNGLSSKITEQGKTLDATVKTANEAKSTADSNKTAISQVSTTANDALSKTSSLEQNLSGFKTSVANTYTTKADFNNLTIGGTNLLLNTSGVFVGHPSTSGVGADAGWLPLLVDGLTYSTLSAGTYQLRFEVMTDTEVGSYIVQWAGTPWGISSFSLSKGVWKTLTYTIVKPDGATGKARGFMLRTDNVPTSATIRVRRAKLERGSRPTDWSPAPQDSQAAGDYATNSSLTQTANQIRGEVSEKYQPKSGMSSYATVSALSQKANEITGRVQEVAKTAQGNTTTISQVSQKADMINTTLSQKIDGKADTSRVSSLEQNLDGFKTGVAKTYQTKGDYPTKAEVQSRIDQTSRSVALGVVQNYKGADGSGLATKSDISVSRTEITSEVSNTYATKDGVSKEISSKITQNNSSWELKFASKTEAKSAQDTANTANAAASDAQSRVGNLEPCIRMTSDGVRVGKRSGDSFTGTSALVGTDATFDVLDTSGKRLLEVNATGVKFPHSKDGTRLALGYVAGTGSASDTLYIGDIITGQQEGGPRNRLGFTGDEVSLEGGDININANDNQLSLYGRKGANLLVPDGGNVQVGGQSGTSNTTLTLRGSTVNMSGGLVNVNGRTLNAPVDAKQSQRWDNIQLDVKCVNRVVTVNILHPLGSNVIIGDTNDQCEIGYIKEGYRPSRMIGCHLAAYNTTNLFLEINPSTGKVACFRLWGNQNTWAYFSASLSYVI